MKYPYVLPELPYAYDALEPYIDEETMHYHHDKHFKTYIDNLNKALAPYPMLQEMSLEWLLTHPYTLPERDKTGILNNAGGVYNHNLFFESLTPIFTQAVPQGEMLKMLQRRFGTYEDFVAAFTASALAVFGSGWTYLVITPGGNLEIVNVANQDTLLYKGFKPLMLVDVWEHAYYLKYKNLRAEYLKNIFNVVKWPD